MFGGCFSEFAFWVALYFMFNEDHVPDVEMLNGEVGWFRALWLLSIGWTASLIKPWMFVFSQFYAVFTDDDTDLKDFALLFMD